MISEKQKKILSFPYSKYTALICDGAVRSGKTSIMTIAFIDWAMREFSGQRFGICGKTVDSASKNIIAPYMAMTYPHKRYMLRWRRSDKILEVCRGATRNCFEVFGGKDESSAALIQGRTFAGVLLDEVVLMPESFVQQALARCSVDGARLWFSCNPGNPSHWFYEHWIKRHDDRNALYLRFEMTDNPSLSAETLERYETMYPSGVFYDRYIRGLWVVAEGLVYPMWQEAIADPPDGKAEKYMLSIDYGTMNAFAVLLWEKHENVWYATREYYYSGRDEGIQKTDEEYARDIDKWCADILPGQSLQVIIDPSAASFIALLSKRGGRYKVIKADNDVADGIRETATAMKTGLIKISPRLKHWKDEVQEYVWDDCGGEDRPVKKADHLQDAKRYFVKTMGIAVQKKANYAPLWSRGR